MKILADIASIFSNNLIKNSLLLFSKMVISDKLQKNYCKNEKYVL